MERVSGFFGNLKKSLSSSSSRLSEGIRHIFRPDVKVDDETLKDLRKLLITTDMGPAMAEFFVNKVAELKFRNVDALSVKQKLAEEIESFLTPACNPIVLNHHPQIILLCGINGSGKTTTVAKLAHKYQTSGKTVLLGACDTFRAAAVEQLTSWAQRISCPIVTGQHGSDAASIAYKTVQQAVESNTDVVLIDTAGRLHNYKNLMEELAKVQRIVRKHINDAPHNTILVLDATIGQNALAQVETFASFVNINGIILTKLDGTAKGGIVLRIWEKHKISLHAVGTGEGIDDLEDFSAHEYACGLLSFDRA